VLDPLRYKALVTARRQFLKDLVHLGGEAPKQLRWVFPADIWKTHGESIIADLRREVLSRRFKSMMGMAGWVHKPADRIAYEEIMNALDLGVDGTGSGQRLRSIFSEVLS